MSGPPEARPALESDVSPPAPLQAVAPPSLPAFSQEPQRQLTQAFGQGPPTQPLPTITDRSTEATTEPQAKSWGSTIFGHFEWTHKTGDPAASIPLIQETEDNPMRYKRRSRRVSLITSDGAVFQFDVPPADGCRSTNADMTNRDNQFIQVGIQDTSMMQDPSAHRPDMVEKSDAPPVGMIMTHRRTRRASLTEIVEAENIRAQTEMEKLPIIVEQTVPEAALCPESNSPEKTHPHQDRSKKKASVFDTWFFRSPEREQAEENSDESNQLASPAESRKTSVGNMEGIGGGQLTSKIVKALEIRSPSRKESQQMNMWMPQGM